MTRFWIVSRKQLRIGAIVFSAILVAAAFWRYESVRSEQAVEAGPQSTRIVHMVTGEVKSKLENGSEIEMYQFIPGTVHAKVGERVELRIRGGNGIKHDFEIESMNLKGSIEKDKETVITFTAKEGVHRIVCLTHPDMKHEGPMVGYIVVDSK
ncbi:cupredoxin domain-containing protein [Paenibacillus alvei]|uniref:cupredoxin domain-containing protein n=1 Tax=Paenibacillus alvei TaxID=44250 RepID=UPI0018CF0ABE|nr:cupredoxin domain-containing protein [Paenibacillus alvei]MCY9578921.1 cupredoxin domain-containing protein [Paenibacillus alvei]MCY9583976.1 cupredoxin domain-containing protein [Paenibacillus alvei]